MAKKFSVVKDIFEQLEKEADAQKNYAEFIADHAQHLESDDIAKIEEIMGDEGNHTQILVAMAIKYGGPGPTDDGLDEALETIAKSAGVSS